MYGDLRRRWMYQAPVGGEYCITQLHQIDVQNCFPHYHGDSFLKICEVCMLLNVSWVKVILVAHLLTHSVTNTHTHTKYQCIQALCTATRIDVLYLHCITFPLCFSEEQQDVEVCHILTQGLVYYLDDVFVTQIPSDWMLSWSRNATKWTNVLLFNVEFFDLEIIICRRW
jgi:hypothetical protein